ncbi:hypothetical protein TTHERM_00176920 (macronuclear) [Tetrahymena thermophila SB210]|uniref:Zinc finger lsd1 subclass family protein n=1 Tax=Tetrahymena thermophila (strain SB210) TaxID=312017 RepID=Q22TC8_TETTS|nr:hypothetical protein TTHERM_00176920 [Tetrahymena thermophila SB210]EAR88510.3 hypothetical protein TTHERM_00176920 [Tetrahymena thermophila SB210]|eukprot:XP_001008755.3 hypothetical protein TTHERM_00176920 [Tetrahymena thermophila SB210]
MIIGFSCSNDPNCIRCFESGCSACADNYFLNSSKQCEKCFDPNCVSCKGKRQIDCWACGYEKRYLLEEDSSCTDCNLDGYYKKVQFCLKCLPQCKNCKENNYLCTSCESGYFFNEYTCFKCIPNCQNCNNAITCQLCQSGYFLKGYSCIECIPNCQNCNNETTCELCQSGYHIHEQTNQCVICSQQSGYYISGKYCKQCNVACKECSGPTDLDCTISKIPIKIIAQYAAVSNAKVDTYYLIKNNVHRAVNLQVVTIFMILQQTPVHVNKGIIILLEILIKIISIAQTVKAMDTSVILITSASSAAKTVVPVPIFKHAQNVMKEVIYGRMLVHKTVFQIQIFSPILKKEYVSALKDITQSILKVLFRDKV